MKHSNLKINKEFIYIFIIVLLVIFGLFFLNQQFNVSVSAFTIKEQPKKSSDFFDSVNEKLKDATDPSEMFKNSYYP